MQTYDAHKTTPEVRQGSRRLMNFRVLIWSLVIVVLAFGIIYAISTMIQPGGGGSVTQPATEQGVQATPSDTPSQDVTTTPTPAN